MNGLIDCADTACCTCPPIRREPTTINLNPSGLDVFRSHGHVKLTHPVDVSSVPVSWLLTNSNGVIYQSTLLPGDFTSNLDGSTLFFKDFGARFGNGVREGMYTALLLVSWKDLVYYKVQAYGDMSMATDPDMVLQFYIGDQAFVFKSTWHWTGTAGWPRRHHWFPTTDREADRPARPRSLDGSLGSRCPSPWTAVRVVSGSRVGIVSGRMSSERATVDPPEPPPPLTAARSRGDGGGRRLLVPYLTGLLVAEALLVALYILLPHSDFFDLDKEYNLPSLFSTLQLAAIGVASFFAFEAERRGPARRAPLVWACRSSAWDSSISLRTRCWQSTRAFSPTWFATCCPRTRSSRP